MRNVYFSAVNINKMCSYFLSCCCCCTCEKKENESEDRVNLRDMTRNYEFDSGNTIPRDTSNNVMIAKYNYRNSDSSCIEVKKNDRYTLIEGDDPDWKLVKNLETNAVGYAPAIFFVDEKSLLKEEWYFGDVSRMEVEASLLLSHHKDGTFLIRKSGKNKRFPFVLSVKCDDPTANSHVKHYRIFERASSKQYYITESHKFSSLAELIEVYKRESLLYVRLAKPCESYKPPVGTLSPNHKHWEIPKNEIHISRDIRLGDGQFSTVFHGVWNYSVSVAVKMIKDEAEIEQILKEVNIMKKLKHKNLIMLYGICTLSKPYWIIEEYLEHGDLLSCIKNNDLTELQNIYISYQISDGMEYLESKKIIHRDLAARNILLGANQMVKIADLGLSRNTDEEGNYIMTSELKLPIRWMSPETFTTAKYSSKSDVWSFAILLIELYTNGAKPYAELSNMEIVLKVQAGYRLPKPQKMPGNVYKIVCKCWKASPAKRPTFEELKATFEALYEAYDD